MKTKNLNPIQIFRTGQHTAMNGSTLSFSESDVAAIAANYNPAVHEAPLVVGHPKTDAPAYGWVAGLQFADGVLSAVPSDVDAEFADMVNARRFSKVSASFYLPDSPNNPVTGSYYLRHVGFLGAQPPAVKGLRSPQFASSEDELVIEFECAAPTIEFSTGEYPVMTPEEIAAKQAEIDSREAALAQREAELATKNAAFAEQQAKAKAQELDTVVADLIKEGRVLPKDKNGLLAFMSADKSDDVIEFADGGTVAKQAPHEWLIGFLKALPPQVDFSEYAKGGQGAMDKPVDNQAIARRAQAYKAKMDAQGVNLSFAEAVDGVLADEDKVGA
jgi:hypothetical protein